MKGCAGVNSDGLSQTDEFTQFYKGGLSIEVLVQFFTATRNRINCGNKLSLGFLLFLVPIK